MLFPLMIFSSIDRFLGFSVKIRQPTWFKFKSSWFFLHEVSPRQFNSFSMIVFFFVLRFQILHNPYSTTTFTITNLNQLSFRTSWAFDVTKNPTSIFIILITVNIRPSQDRMNFGFFYFSFSPPRIKSFVNDARPS